MQWLHSLFDRHSEDYLILLPQIMAFIARQQCAVRTEDVNSLDFCNF